MSPKLPNANPIKFVVLDCPYFHLEREETQRLYSKLLNLKIEGYRSEYPVGVMPIDLTDLIATHILICEEVDSGFVPISGFKSVSYERCLKFQLKFPVFDLFREQSFPKHERAIQLLMDQCIRKGQNLCYNSSWTISPSVRQIPEFAKWIRELTVASFIFYYEQIQSKPVLAAAVERFKVHRLKSEVGFRPLTHQGEVLEAFASPAFFGEKLLLMSLSQFAGGSFERVQKFRELWEKRMTITSELVPN